MRTQILTGLAACAVMTVSVVFAPSSATADSSIDQEARGRDSEMFMAKRGLQNRVYLNENGQRVVRLGSDTSGEVRTQILANGDPVQESKFSQKDFDRFEGAVKELGAAEPNTMILSRYNPRDDSFEVFVPDAKAAPVRERVAQKQTLAWRWEPIHGPPPPVSRQCAILWWSEDQPFGRLLLGWHSRHDLLRC